MDDDIKNQNDNSKESTKKKITVISGNGNIDISDVYNHLNVESPSSEDSKRKNIVIPPDNSQK